MLTLEEINDKLNEKYQPIMKERIVFAAEVIRDFESLTATGEFLRCIKR